MEYTAAVLTISDKGSQGLREDKSGPAMAAMLEAAGYRVVYTAILPDDYEAIREALLLCCDEKKVCLAATTGGTGFSKRDITPEATASVIERFTPGIPEAMRAESLRHTPHGMLSRETAGIRGDTLILNLPGSVKAVEECLGAVLPALGHGIDILRGNAAECGEHHHHKEGHHHG